MKTGGLFQQSFFFFFFLFTFLPAQAQYCPEMNAGNISVDHWRPSKGNIARYAAAILDTGTNTGTMIVLGQDSLGLYTIEAGIPDDACGCTYANLVVTGLDGTRKTYSIYDGDWSGRQDSDSLSVKIQEQVRRKIWKFCGEKILVPARLKPVKYHQDKESGSISIRLGNQNMHWSISTESEMCWCFYEWEFYVGK